MISNTLGSLLDAGQVFILFYCSCHSAIQDAWLCLQYVSSFKNQNVVLEFHKGFKPTMKNAKKRRHHHDK